MAAQIETIDESRQKNKRISLNGKRTRRQVSSALKVNGCFNEHELAKVSDLSIQDNRLSSLPSNLGKKLSNLTKVNLTYNNLRELDDSLKTLSHLEELGINKNGLKLLPDYLAKLHNLKIIAARKNKLKYLLENLGDLGKLEELDLGDNQIRNSSHYSPEFNNLRKLNLDYNELQSTPEFLIHGSPSLEILDSSHNNMNNNCGQNLFLAWLLAQKSSSLEELVFDFTIFAAFPVLSTVFRFENLTKLSMVRCGLSDTDFELISQSFVNLEYLDVGNNSPGPKANNFWMIPARSLINPEKLNELNVREAGLPAVLPRINFLKNLTRLDISRNAVSFLPEEICDLKRLELLDAAGNNLYDLPQSLGKLEALRKAFFESNRLSSLPDSIGNLDRLECLDLYDNEFFKVPEQLARIQNLKALDIDGNIFETDNLQLPNLEYSEAKNLLRSTRSFLMFRSNDPKVLDETDNESSISSLDYEPESVKSESLISASPKDVASEEDWEISEDSADEYDPTSTKPRRYSEYSPFTVSSVIYYGNFCPADIHSAKIMDQLAAMKSEIPFNVEEGQFDDA